MAADALEPASLGRALEGCGGAYYLIHAMKGPPKTFAEQGQQAAENFREAADRARLGRIVYLGALGTDDQELSEHLASRQEVGRILASGCTPVVELRAAVIIGSGSMSFEMIRHLTEVLPIIMKPRWVGTRCQPIAVRNVLDILVAMLDDPDPTDTTRLTLTSSTPSTARGFAAPSPTTVCPSDRTNSGPRTKNSIHQPYRPDSHADRGCPRVSSSRVPRA